MIEGFQVSVILMQIGRPEKNVRGPFPLKSSTPCGEVNNTSTSINIKYSELFWL